MSNNIVSSVSVSQSTDDFGYYPRLMRFQNHNCRHIKVVLILGISKDSATYGRGVVVHDSENKDAVGYYSDCWVLSTFEPLPHGSVVTLKA